jgi:hypothetical protein
MSGVNPATGDKEDKRAALMAIGNYTTATLTLATAFLAIGFPLMLASSGKPFWWALTLGMGLLALAITLGCVVLGRQIAMFAHGPLDPMGKRIGTPGLFHLGLLIVALLFVGIFVGNNLDLGDKEPSRVTPSCPSCATPSPTPDPRPSASDDEPKTRSTGKGSPQTGRPDDLAG